MVYLPKIRLTLLALIALVACVGCSAPKAVSIPCGFTSDMPKPGWIDYDYPSSAFIYGIGISSSAGPVSEKKQVARLEAKRDLAQQLSVEVFSRFEHQVSTQGEEYVEHVRTLTRQVSEMQLTSVSIVDSWQDGDGCVVYSLARMPKEKADRLYGQVKEVLR